MPSTILKLRFFVLVLNGMNHGCFKTKPLYGSRLATKVRWLIVETAKEHRDG